jgi:predicted RNA-binding Zn-ribbon protein involved in translation (DUF1610 family)
VSTESKFASWVERVRVHAHERGDHETQRHCEEIARLRARVAELERDDRPRVEHPCPDCGGEVLRQDYAMDSSDYRCRDQFDCCWTSESAPPDPDADGPDEEEDQ